MSKGAVLHALFTLAHGVAETEFISAFEAFYEHLREMGFVCAYKIVRRQPLEGFGVPLPAFDYDIAIEFPTLKHDQACYDYVKMDQEPVRSLHRAMNSKVKPGTEHFFLGVSL